MTRLYKIKQNAKRLHDTYSKAQKITSELYDEIEELGLNYEEDGLDEILGYINNSEGTAESCADMLMEEIKEQLSNKDYDNLALQYAEQVGIIEWKVKNNIMMYCTNYPQEKSTIKVTINLNSMEEIRLRLKNYYVKGNVNMCL